MVEEFVREEIQWELVCFPSDPALSRVVPGSVRNVCLIIVGNIILTVGTDPFYLSTNETSSKGTSFWAVVYFGCLHLIPHSNLVSKQPPFNLRD